MNNEIITVPEGRYRRVSKAVARTVYENGGTIYVVPSNVIFNFKGPWVRPFEMNRSEFQNRYCYGDLDDEIKFDNVLNNYEYYNCCYELGTYVRFYVQIDGYGRTIYANRTYEFGVLRIGEKFQFPGETRQYQKISPRKYHGVEDLYFGEGDFTIGTIKTKVVLLEPKQ